jgi:hypothetical protein
VYRNLQQAIREIETGDYPENKAVEAVTITNLKFPNCGANCDIININNGTYIERIIYVKGRDVILGTEGGELSPITWGWVEMPDPKPWNVAVVADGGNIFVNKDMKNTDNKYGSTLGLIALRSPKAKSLGESGNLYLHGDVKNLRSVAIILDGSLFSYISATQGFLNNGEPQWEDYEGGTKERLQSLQQQFMLEGILQSRNTIGGGELSSKETYTIGSGIKLKDTIKNKIRAQLYDLNFLRFFKLDLQYDETTGFPIDQSCKRPLEDTEITQFLDAAKLGTAAPDIKGTGINENTPCDGIQTDKPANDTTSGEKGDLVPTGSNTYAEGGENIGDYPVFIKYVPPSNYSFIFSSQNVLTF